MVKSYELYKFSNKNDCYNFMDETWTKWKYLIKYINDINDFNRIEMEDNIQKLYCNWKRWTENSYYGCSDDYILSVMGSEDIEGFIKWAQEHGTYVLDRDLDYYGTDNSNKKAVI